MDEIVKVFILLHINHPEKLQVQFLKAEKLYKTLKHEKLNHINVIILPAFEQRVDHHHHGLGLNKEKYPKILELINQWLERPNRRIFPTLEQINGEGTKDYYDILIRELNNISCMTIPTIRVDSDESFEAIIQKLKNFCETVNNEDVFVKRTYSCESKDVEKFPVVGLSQSETIENIEGIIEWMKEKSTFLSKRFMVQEFIETNWPEYRVVVVGGKAVNIFYATDGNSKLNFKSLSERRSKMDNYEEFWKRLCDAGERVINILSQQRGYEHLAIVSRADFFFHNGQLYVNEVQGMTSISFFSSAHPGSEDEYQRQIGETWMNDYLIVN